MESNSKFPLLVATVLLASVSAGCSSEKNRNYSVPKSLCGIEIDQDLYESLLPPGDSLGVRDLIRRNADGSTGANGGCHVIVDGENALSLSSVSSDQATNVAMLIDERGYYLDLVESERLYREEEFEVRVWPQESMSFIECVRSEYENTGIGINIDVSWTLDEDFSEILQEITVPYVEARLAEIEAGACVTG
jgi:hypothetical protein